MRKRGLVSYLYLSRRILFRYHPYWIDTIKGLGYGHAGMKKEINKQNTKEYGMIVGLASRDKGRNK